MERYSRKTSPFRFSLSPLFSEARRVSRASHFPLFSSFTKRVLEIACSPENRTPGMRCRKNRKFVEKSSCYRRVSPEEPAFRGRKNFIDGSE